MSRDREQRRRDKQAKKARQRPQGKWFELNITKSAHAGEMLTDAELREIVTSTLQEAANIPEWKPGKSYVIGFEKYGTRFNLALDNRVDGIFALVGREGEVTQEPAPAT